MEDTILSNENRYNLLAGRVPMLVNRFLSQQLKNEGVPLTREQWSVLAVLWKSDGCSQQHIADATFRDKPSITRLIDNLEKEQLVERHNAPNDRRLNLIFLTPKGKKMEQKVLKVVNDTISKATENLSNEEILTIKNGFEKVYQNIKKYE
ncbi:MarR family winged helix-turn-helix transcriptional regulator [Riemerella columbina]|uniref:MarR family winged helix-turn-helix transcriptional regulator n=1 Tax=Riemerella columbina TaxID=103810 RepID=UPI0026704D6D|nr:MarR family winged helix-turn-helix transcriptional regulator [Riemerella columbina]WKS95400.1 MarR family winged helix-turn-helix transcriptional regulator [Riemerella columbina]